MNGYYLTPEDYDKAAANGIDAKLLYKRHFMYGWTIDRAVNQPRLQMGPRKSIKQWAEIAEKNGICYNTFTSRVNKWGWDMERAATQPLQDKREQITKMNRLQQKYPDKYLELYKKNGIPQKTFYKRISKGMTPEQAATMPIMSASEKGRKGGMVCAGKRKKPAGATTPCGQ